KSRLSNEGYDIYLVELQNSWDKETPPPELLECQKNADACIILLDEKCENYPSFSGAVSGAKGQGCNIIVMRGRSNYIPKEIDEKANSVLPIKSPSMSSSLGGTSIWEDMDSNPMPKRDINRVKCQ
ncbi:hypothetical protein, partial [Klebsiella variicola]|uniref:hypothetical protein n=1 Tax=Klebsiella variicola TaxID=244366 RepID=UPI001A9132F9